MKALIITPLYPPAVGGAATYFGNIMPELARRDAIEQVIVLTERMSGQPHQWTEGRLRVLRYLPTRVSRPQRRWLGHAVTYVLTQLWFAMQLPALVRHHDVDLIHFHTRYRGRLFFAVLRNCRLPIIADLRDKMTDPGQLAGVADRLLCCGEGVKRFAIAGGFPADQTALIPIPFTPPEIPSATQVSDVRRRFGLGKAPYVLFVGDITHNKGAWDLLQAYQQWRHEHPQVRIVFAGINRQGERFATHVQQTEGARYLGYVPRRDALALMHGAEIVALPSRAEGLPRVILEAVALGTKVLCPPGIPEFERHLPRFVLPEVSAESVVKMLNAVWHCHDLPSYPLTEHKTCYVVEKLLSTYADALK